SGSLDDVVAGQGVDDQPVVGRLGADDVDLRRQAKDVDAACVTNDRHGVSPRAGIDNDGIGLAVADAAAEDARQIEVDLSNVGAGQVIDGDGVGAAPRRDVDYFDA